MTVGSNPTETLNSKSTNKGFEFFFFVKIVLKS